MARHAKAGFAVREHGWQGYCGPRMVFYASRETHGWCQKAAELMGFGNSAFRRVPADCAFRLDLGALRTRIESDRREKMRPFCVVGNAGTISTGAIDDLRAIRRICQEEQLWFHVDGAFGALARLSNDLRGWWKASKRRIRWLLICTSGCICRSTWDACWYEMPRHTEMR